MGDTLSAGTCLKWRYITSDNKWVMVSDERRTNQAGRWFFIPRTSLASNPRRLPNILTHGRQGRCPGALGVTMGDRTTMLVATTALVIAGCGGASQERTGAMTTSTTSQASVTVAPKPAWVPSRLRARFAARGPKEPGCGFLANERRTAQYDFYVSGGARCRTALLVLADFDAHLSKTDPSPSCEYRLCEPKSRTYRGYRCRLVHQFDDDYEYVCTRGTRKISFGSGG